MHKRAGGRGIVTMPVSIQLIERVRNSLTGSKTFWVKAVILAQLFFIGWSFSPEFSTNGDNAKYFALGQALFSGQGYRNVALVDQPVETQYPVVFPFLLGLISLFSTSPLLAKIVMAFLPIVITYLCFILFSRSPVYLLFPLLLLLAFSRLMADYAIILMSEIPYLLAVCMSFVLLEKSIRNPRSKALFWTAQIVALLPVHCRSLGLAFSGAWIAGNLLDRRYRYALVHIALFLATSILFKIVTSWENPYVMHLFLKNSYNPDLGYVSLYEMVERIGKNIVKYSRHIVPQVLFPLPRIGKDAQFLLVIRAVVVDSLCITGLIKNLSSKRRLFGIYTVLYFGLLSIWQWQWSSERFIVGVLPFLYFFFIEGIFLLLWGVRRLFSKQAYSEFLSTTPRRVRTIAWVIIVCVIGANIYYNAAKSQNRRTIRPEWRHFYSCADWIRYNTEKDAVVMSRKPQLFYLRSKRRGVIYPFTHDVDRVIEAMKEHTVTHVVLDNFSWTKTTARYLFPAISSHPEHFNVVYALDNPSTLVLEFKP
jgi:hypothetical protein